jgi:hypothetical protein
MNYTFQILFEHVCVISEYHVANYYISNGRLVDLTANKCVNLAMLMLKTKVSEML